MQSPADLLPPHSLHEGAHNLYQIKLMTTFHILSHLDSFITAAMRIYALGSELFSITAILFCVNFVANMIRHTYQAGYAFGKFYRTHLHRPLKWLIIHLITLIILLTQLAGERAVVIYNNREEIRASIKNAWRTFERAFIYESPIYN